MSSAILAGHSKYRGMDNYTIKVKKVHRPAFCLIMVWLQDDEDISHNQDNIKHEQLTLAWISYHEGLRRKMVLTEGDSTKLIRGLCNHFRSDFADNIDNIIQVTSLEQALTMVKLVETFISDCVLTKINY